ncbi:MAG: polyribonucleotide nucleotidyltransferase [bacterium]|nr:polyribonucleotide nucleotidyltransferase [bacterium]
MNGHKTALQMNGAEYSLETGKMARQAGGACVVGLGDTRVLVTATADKNVSDRDFLPLFVEYRNKTYAAGKIPGGFFKREARPSERETLSARLIDRPLRPLFPDGYRHATDVVAFVISSDTDFHADVLSITGASLALNLSDVPFGEYVSGVRVAEIAGEFVPNPTFAQLEESSMDLVVAGTDDIVCMIEGSCSEVSEDRLLDAIDFAHGWIRQLNALQRELVAKAGAREKFAVAARVLDPAKLEAVRAAVASDLDAAIRIKAKHTRQDAVAALHEKVKTTFADEAGKPDAEALAAFAKLEKKAMRAMVVDEGVRADGRDLTTVRPIDIELGLLPRVHGSALFTRGETQSLGTVTLGTKSDEQKIDALEGEWWSPYYLHYNFPPFSVGETGRYSGTGRREIGHGKLAERALRPLLPTQEDFPYTIRIVSDILESNGSSSMATVCSASLALMQAGVPIKKAVAGVAMGLIKEGEKVAVLTDILGVEDHLGDMDFKVTGTRDGITAFQMDTKIGGISRAIMLQALTDARNARHHILGIMHEAIAEPAKELCQYAPKIITIQIPPKRIGELIGPGGKVIKKLQEETETNIDINDDGLVFVSAPDQAKGNECVERIRMMMTEPEVGAVYTGRVVSIVDFGAFVEYLPGKEGLLHISEIEHFRVGNVEDVLQINESVQVKLVEVDSRSGKVRLSRKALLPVPEGVDPNQSSDRGPRRDGGDRGGRGGGGGRDRDRGPRRR